MKRARSNAPVGTGAEHQSIIVDPPDHEPGWQYLYLASELERGLANLETEDVAHEAHLAHRTDTSLVSDPISGAKARLGVLQDALRTLNRALSKETTDNAFRGGEADIRSLASVIIGIYALLMRWAQSVRDAAVPADYVPMYDALAELADFQIRQIRAFSVEWGLGAKDMARSMRSGLPYKPFRVSFKFDLGDAALAHVRATMDALKS
jgi:hypothetical protein